MLNTNYSPVSFKGLVTRDEETYGIPQSEDQNFYNGMHSALKALAEKPDQTDLTDMKRARNPNYDLYTFKLKLPPEGDTLEQKELSVQIKDYNSVEEFTVRLPDMNKLNSQDAYTFSTDESSITTAPLGVHLRTIWAHQAVKQIQAIAASLTKFAGSKGEQ